MARLVFISLQTKEDPNLKNKTNKSKHLCVIKCVCAPPFQGGNIHFDPVLFHGGETGLRLVFSSQSPVCTYIVFLFN